jgi:phage gp36-like protein
MGYATFEDVLVRYKPLGTMIGAHSMEVTTVDVSSIFIWGAQGVIDGYLGARYEVPLAEPVSPLITRIACDLATFDMMAEKLPAVPDFMRDRYSRSIELLELLRDGKMVITSATLTTSGDQDAWSSNSNFHPVFSPVLDIETQGPDADQVRAEADLRGFTSCPSL